VTRLTETFLPPLLDPALPVPEGLLDGQGNPAGRRFDVYRNNVTASLIAALEVGFPAIVKLLGSQNFTTAARLYVQDNPPASQLMMHYGTAFPAFLEAAAPLAHLGYLGDVARLELALRRAYHAADAAPLAPEILGAITPEDLGSTRLTLAPAAELLRSRWPVHVIWAFNMIPDSPKPQPLAQDVLVTRPGFDPVVQPLPKGGAAFIEALMAGQTLGAAHDAGLAQDGAFDPTETLGLLIAGGAVIAAQAGPAA